MRLRKASVDDAQEFSAICLLKRLKTGRAEACQPPRASITIVKNSSASGSWSLYLLKYDKLWTRLSSSHKKSFRYSKSLFKSPINHKVHQNLKVSFINLQMST